MHSAITEGLNEEQRQAVEHGDSPLLIVAGAGSGKTKTLVHRVAAGIDRGIDPGRILLLTFTRRAAAEMLHRVTGLLRQVAEVNDSGQRRKSTGLQQIWGGTFHAVATRLLRVHGKSIGLPPEFTIHDRSDSEDLLDVIRTELGLAKTDKRFPKKGTCMAIYSLAVNARLPLEQLLEAHYPWCSDYAADLKRLFQQYVDRKEHCQVLDYDDLLLFWQGILAHPETGERLRSRFDMVLVDEFQDTNPLQADILQLLRPGGQGLTVVGDDAQSIYSFRAATVRNILDFPQQYPGTTIVKLEQNYRSVQPILAATNAVIAQARERFTKDLWSERSHGEQPILVTCQDEDEQAAYLVRQILEQREAGTDLRRQAVLFRTSHHSMTLEAELARCNIPFVKYGGLKFIEAAHIKDLLSFLRLAENPRDLVSGSRILLLLPGVGPQRARQWMTTLLDADGDFRVWGEMTPPKAAAEHWPGLVQLMQKLVSGKPAELPAQICLIRSFYGPLLEEKYDNVDPRLRDLEQLEQLAVRFPDRGAMLTDLALDPPASSEDLAGEPLLDEDYLILSTIHSAKGLEWDVVYVIHAADGNIPSDMATGSPEQIDEELRLFYVALTRARNALHVCFPQRYYHAYRGPKMDRYGFAQLTRFLPKRVKEHFDCRVSSPPLADAESSAPTVGATIRQQVKSLWK